MTEEKKQHQAQVAADKKARKEANREKRKEDAKATAEVDNAIQMEKFKKQIEEFSVNRRARRQFRKASGFMLPPVNFPYRKDGAVANAEAVDKSIVS